MASGAFSSLYTRLLRDFNVVAELTSIGDVSVTRDDIETTHYDSDDGYKEYIAGLADGGEITVEGNFIVGDTNGQLGLKADYEAGTIQSFIVAMPNETLSSWEFTAMVKEFGETQPIGDVIGFTATLKVTGKNDLWVAESAWLSSPFFTLSGDVSGSITPSPAASATIFLYSATAGSSDATVTVTPTSAADAIYVNGTITPTGVGVGISVASGETTPIYIITKTDERSPRIHKINVFRP